MINVNDLKIGKKYKMNKREMVYMGMFSDMASPLAGFHLFVGIEDGLIRALRKTDMLENASPLVLNE